MNCLGVLLEIYKDDPEKFAQYAIGCTLGQTKETLEEAKTSVLMFLSTRGAGAINPVIESYSDEKAVSCNQIRRQINRGGGCCDCATCKEYTYYIDGYEMLQEQMVRHCIRNQGFAITYLLSMNKKERERLCKPKQSLYDRGRVSFSYGLYGGIIEYLYNQGPLLSAIYKDGAIEPSCMEEIHRLLHAGLDKEVSKINSEKDSRAKVDLIIDADTTAVLHERLNDIYYTLLTDDGDLPEEQVLLEFNRLQVVPKKAEKEPEKPKVPIKKSMDSKESVVAEPDGGGEDSLETTIAVLEQFKGSLAEESSVKPEPKKKPKEKKPVVQKELPRQQKTAEEPVSVSPAKRSLSAEERLEKYKKTMGAMQTVFTLRNEDITFIPIIRLVSDLEGLYYNFLQNKTDCLPVEVVILEDSNRYLLCLISGKYYLIAPELTDDFLKRGFFKLARAICFLPMELLAMFPALVKVHSIEFMFHARYLASENQTLDLGGILGFLFDEWNEEGTVLSYMKHYLACYQKLYTGMGDRMKATYLDLVNECIFRSGSYTLSNVRKKEDVKELFRYDGKGFIYSLQPYNLIANPGYTKFCIRIDDIPENMNPKILTAIATQYCNSHAIREIRAIFIGCISNRNEFYYIVPDHTIGMFLDLIHLQYMRITQELIGHPVQIHIITKKVV